MELQGCGYLAAYILFDLHRKNNVQYLGNALDKKYTGISVHRVYDCLDVLLQNAHNHGEANSYIEINVNAIQANSNRILDIVTINISSTVSEYLYAESKKRIIEAIEAKEQGKDMVTEGYTGIKKIKFISKSSEGNHTVEFKACDIDKKIELSFTLHSEVDSSITVL